jgi:hypothetical protein
VVGKLERETDEGIQRSADMNEEMVEIPETLATRRIIICGERALE